jgi:hypothetical protein
MMIHNSGGGAHYNNNNSSSNQPAFDFGDIHDDHCAEPIVPADPSWDANRVLFNEFHPHRHNNDDKVFFSEQIEVSGGRHEWTVSINQAVKEEGLDPLGWPVVQEGFQTNMPFDTAHDDSNDNNITIDDPDDEDLLGGFVESDTMEVPTSNNNNNVESLGERITHMLTFCSAGTETDLTALETTTRVLTKEERIRLYTTIIPDDDSSVEEEEEEHDNDDEVEEEVAYLQQQEEEKDDNPNMETHDMDWTAPEPFHVDFASFAPATTAATAATHSSHALKSKVKLKDPTNAPTQRVHVPVIAPPSKEKLSKWHKQWT